ncbi:MAG: TetR/AcrR family transcriptional regulator [Coriobacteriia bacterium]|nr:TetR/AcrR family transcriptional regulator [Coriobacteriia bacterium]
MARPKRVAGEKTAYERMEDAFWEMIAEMPYHKMTGKELRERAGVSHNTFYYYFSDMDDMACKLFEGLNIAEGPMTVFAAMQQGKHPASVVATIPDFSERYRKLCLLAGSGSPMLVGMLRKAAITAWLSAAGLSEADLTSEDRIDLEFAFGGGIALLASGMIDDPSALAGFPDREVGHGILTKLQNLAQR